jgi:hypothetical protein
VVVSVVVPAVAVSSPTEGAQARARVRLRARLVRAASMRGIVPMIGGAARRIADERVARSVSGDDA